MVDVQRTLADREILLTGGAGFLGKIILAMLLDRYPEVRRLHLLLRSGRGRSAQAAV
jgi:long-chain acyl-CoA synthetase